MPHRLPTGALHDAVLGLLDARAFAQAQQIIESLAELGDRSPVLDLAYAICLIETGAGQRAIPLVHAIEAALSQARFPADAALLEALGAVRERLPGGAWDPGRLAALRTEAERTLPIARKPPAR